MKKISSVSVVHVPHSGVEDIYNHLRACGEHEMEGVALLAGMQHEHNFYVETIIIPAQTSYKMKEGLLYAVGGDELHRINTWLYKNNMTLIGQVHSHPGAAYHSDTDDRYPIVATFGALSIVIPDFAFGPPRVENWAVYRLLPDIGWNELSTHEVDALIKIE